jgi:hypothetical protein
MSKLVTTEKLEAAFEFIRIANERGGYVHLGHDVIETLPILQSLLLCPENNTHLPEPKTVMMQMWREERDGTISAFPVGESPFKREERDGTISAFPVKKTPFCGAWSKVGEPFEFTYPEESE